MAIPEQFARYVPNFSGLRGGLTTLIVILAFVIILGILAYFIISARRYNKKIIIFENIGGRGYMPVGNDKAMLVKIGDDGEQILYLKKHKVYKQAHGRKMGKNTYWFAVGSDGYWYNFVMNDLDNVMGAMDIEPIDKDMRAFNIAIRRNIAERYDKVGFLAKYGVLIANIGFFLIMAIMLYLMWDKWLAGLSISNQVAETNLKVLEQMKNVLSGIDSVKGTGALVPP